MKRRNLLHIFPVIFILVLALLSSPAFARSIDDDEDDDEDEIDIAVLYVPPVFKGEFGDKDISNINKRFFKSVKKREGYEVYTYKSLKKIIRSKKIVRKIRKCKTKKGCLVKAARKTDLRLVVSGIFHYTDDDEVNVKMVVMDLQKGDIINTFDKTFESMRDARSSKKLRALTKILLPEPDKLFGRKTDSYDDEDDEDEDEEDEDDVDISSGPKAERKAHTVAIKRPKRYRPQQVRNEIRENLRLVLMNKTGDAITGLKKVRETMKCECNEDGHASDVLALLEEFQKSEKAIDTGIKNKNSKTILAAADSIEHTAAALGTELETLKLQGSMTSAIDLKQVRAQGYLFKGNGEEMHGEYVDAINSWKKALEYDPNMTEATNKLKQTPVIAKRLIAQARTMAAYDTKGARKKLEMVLDLIKDENDNIHQEALDALDEVEDYEE